MKKLIALTAIAVIACFAAISINAQNNTAATKQNTQQMAAQTTPQTEQITAECRLFFSQVLNAKEDHSLEMFEDRVEYFLKSGYFWEACLAEQLANNQDIILNYTGYIAGPTPTEMEMKHLLKSAAEFKDELESYIEGKTLKHSPLHKAEHYTVLKAVPGLTLSKRQQKMLRRENRKFRPDYNTGKIFIHINAVQNQQNTGSVEIEVDD